MHEWAGRVRTGVVFFVGVVKNMAFLHILILIIIVISQCNVIGQPQISQKFVDEIKDYQDIANKIIEYSLNGTGQNQSYNRLATFVDKYGARVAGSEELEDAIDYMLDRLRVDGLDNVHGEEVNVTHWVRGNEWAQLLIPRMYKISILGLGSSIGTPQDGIIADAVVMRSFDELDQRKDEVRDRIVIFNPTYRGYGNTVQYRVDSASKAAKYGAKATLIRTIAPFSIYTPHTGMQRYDKDVLKIPTACITIEDANMFDRLELNGERLRIQLYMEAKDESPRISRNTVAELTGSSLPDEVVVVSGHMDSWDVGQGAMDDGGGAFISWQALSTIKALGLKPKRTIRLIMWTDEEGGGIGSQQYYELHKKEANNISIMFESDEGVFTPYGIQFTGASEGKDMMKEIGKLLTAINASEVYDRGGGTDVAWWRSEKVPTGSIANHNEDYFWYHHSNGDTMDVLNPHQMNLCSAVWTVYAYVLADMNELLPRG